jgi:hypothetical protein
MKRSPIVTAVNVLQSCLAIVLAGLTIYLIALTRSKEILAESDSSETVHGLLIGAMVFGIPAVITTIAAFGLWSRRFWGWALSLATNVGLLGVLVYNIVRDNERDTDEIAMAVGIVVPIILLLLPAVRKFYWNAAIARPAESQLT